MLEVLAVVAPVFALIGLGWLAVKTGFFSEQGADHLLGFINRVASPALLFTGGLRMSFGPSFDPRVISAYYGGALLVFGLGFLLSRRGLGLRPGEATAFAFACAFSNTLFIGYPLSVRAFGPGAEGPAFAVIGMHAPLLYLVGMTVMETTKSDGRGARAALKDVGRGFVRNPLLWGAILGVLANATRFPVPKAMADAAAMLGNTAPAGGLFALGGTLAVRQLRGALKGAALAAGVKILAHPVLVLGLATLFAAPSEPLRVAMVLAAAPGGLNIYLFATLYKRGEDTAAGAMLIGTAAAALTYPVWLILIHRLWG